LSTPMTWRLRDKEENEDEKEADQEKDAENPKA
jgi:hypothetical protein